MRLLAGIFLVALGVLLLTRCVERTEEEDHCPARIRTGPVLYDELSRRFVC